MNSKDIKRFWRAVNKLDHCWEWQSTKLPFGYGVFTVQGVVYRAHRFSYELHKHRIPIGMHVLHKCDNPSCVNPDHLWLGTHADNMKDKIKKGRAKTKLTPEDVRWIQQLGATQDKIASCFGIAQSLVSMIKSGKKWKHLEEIKCQ